ncbi:MAG: acriflavine resistance protein B [Rhodobacterales bacterium]|nr:MAG: acriflavine resistance protein B [Rhodobacterales bacterium]
MIRIVDWAAAHARMVMAFIILSLAAGAIAYVNLPKEGEPDIEIPVLIVSVPFPGISASDSEKLLVKPMENTLADLDGLKEMSATSVDNYAVVVMEFDFGWNKTEIIADVRDKMNNVEAEFPAGADKYHISEFNFSEFPIIIVNLTGNLPERTLLRLAKALQDRLEGLEAVLDAVLTGHRDEMVEVLIDPLRLEAYNVTAIDLINAVVNNNQLIAAGEIESETGTFSIKIPSSFEDTQDIYDLPIRTNGDRIVTLGDLAEIRLTFEDRRGVARFNGENTVAIQVSKRKGYNIIDTADLIREVVAQERAMWPPELQSAVTVGTSNDQSNEVKSMVAQLESSVLTAISLVMVVILATLGTRPALLVGFAIPTSFLLCFVLLALMGVAISNIVMFGLILAVGMLVDGAIVVVEYADRRIREGMGPMHAYVAAAKRMFWPIVSSTATTLCAFLPMLFWPGIPGQFMGMLPVTLIFVLSASLVVALIYLPVMGGVTGRFSRALHHGAELLRPLPWLVRLVLAALALYLIFVGAMLGLNPHYIPPFGALLAPLKTSFAGTAVAGALQAVPFLLAAILGAMAMDAVKPRHKAKRLKAGYRRTPFGWLIRTITGNPILPLLTVALVIGFVITVISVFTKNNNGVEFFISTEPERAIIYVQQRGNLSLAEKDAAVAQVEQIALNTEGIRSTFAFAGAGGLNQNTGGKNRPLDSIGQVQIELTPWQDRKGNPALSGNAVMKTLRDQLAQLPAIQTEVFEFSGGPADAKPVNLRLKGTNWDDLKQAAQIARAKFEQTRGLKDIEDTRPLPGIDWKIDVDVEKAGRYGADVRTVGAMVQLITRGILLDTMRVDSSDDEIEIRVRLPEQDRLLSTLDNLRVRTRDGLVPLSNFITRTAVKKQGQISRVDKRRHFDVKAAVETGLSKTVTDEDGNSREVVINPNERIETLTQWLEAENPFPPGISWEWSGDNENQEESAEFLSKAFLGALGLMFVILLAQFNSFYNAVLVLLAVVLSTTGVLLGMLVMDQAFSVIMTGTGIVALAGIVVNNNIVLIDTYNEYSSYMPRLEAIARTAQSRLRPVLLTTVTTMAGLAPMMLGLSLDFFAGGYTLNNPTALWWIQLATAIVFGLGISTMLTLVFTPSMLAIRVWLSVGAYKSLNGLKILSFGRNSQAARDWALNRAGRKVKLPDLVWGEERFDAPPAPEQAEEEAHEDVQLEALQKVVESAKPKQPPTDAPDEPKAAE